MTSAPEVVDYDELLVIDSHGQTIDRLRDSDSAYDAMKGERDTLAARVRELEEEVAALREDAERVLKDIRWRVDDTREQLLTRTRGGDGDSLYGIDEWSAPAINLQRVMDIIDAARATDKGEG